MNYFTVVMNLLRERQQFLDDIKKGVKLKPKLIGLLISSTVFFGIYGAIIGSSSSPLQALVSAIKLPALYLLTLVICFPTLYFFNVMFGSKRTFEQYLTLLMTAMAMISVLMFGFAPVSLFFLLSTKDYDFFLLLNVLIMTITGGLGIQFFYQGMQYLFLEDPEGKDLRLNILRFWLGLYAFVGTQLGWTLRPFFGSPGMPFQLLRDRESNFYVSLLNSIGSLLGLN
ncbi:actin-binding WH2 domain-containing protein [Planktothrix sp. FACHB-1365]|uniref:actin-binding WH2 domain-containing protein n=1 Tax=Planktothrix sp. FACHB-1365 TaxID=2692855 RepID=UPI0016882658|nr:actin-binding WH2 domain-containing protein [Planktothrix sp. FACHB-1365]MBD2485752.1 actin-binding WH2 domain-containing protein [Planktothrix sp. FACHB-1365]